ncbi:LpqB family beta-propeller domain-containing protein [Sinomonas sp. ASV486]|uniref:LpqB family beta-propeller domain-containing protein n=1 Tax=Sinomonas sp. ASV486 TaxID=3051170 RepID=UPI0027DCBDCC|nr:LpqB family beta-propeller domain-containing protein [Sinomonas sp. ASV486]MDQ4491004.1 LpqB family beta-propeller domain-containing protein [Sinomonas sp. ASV486]
MRRVIPAALVALLLALAALAGCAQIPTTGPVGKSRDGAVTLGNAPQYIPPGPRDGSTPQATIEGFFNAGSGYQNDFTVARQFLAPAQSVSWKPSNRTLVYRGSATVVANGQENGYSYEFDLAYSVDGEGIATPFPAGTKEHIDVTLSQVDGQWRVSKLPDGTAIPEETFKQLYKSFPLYFYDPSFTILVPDVRWFIDNSGVAKSLVSALIAGPAPYLRSAVTTAFPQGIHLERESVPIVDNTAQVDFTSELRDASFTDRQRMRNQLLRTFTGISSVVGVTLRSNQSDVAIDDPSGGRAAPDPIVDPKVPSWQIGVAGGELVQYVNRQATRIDGLRSVSQFGPHQPAAAVTQHLYAFIGDGPALYSVMPDQAPRLLDSRTRLSPPSISPFDWIWTAGPGANGATEVVAYKPAGVAEGAEVPKVTMAPGWLAGRTVEDLRISRDGARALVLSTQGGSTVLQLAGVVRAADGTPRELTTPITLSTTEMNPRRAVWVDEVTVLVSGVSANDPVTPELVSLKGGDPRQLPALAGIQSVSAGNGDQEITAQTSAGVFLLARTTWIDVGKGVEGLSSAG